jgi:hypothetical protein
LLIDLTLSIFTSEDVIFTPSFNIERASEMFQAAICQNDWPLCAKRLAAQCRLSVKCCAMKRHMEGTVCRRKTLKIPHGNMSQVISQKMTILVFLSDSRPQKQNSVDQIGPDPFFCVSFLYSKATPLENVREAI